MTFRDLLRASLLCAGVLATMMAVPMLASMMLRPAPEPSPDARAPMSSAVDQAPAPTGEGGIDTPRLSTARSADGTGATPDAPNREPPLPAAVVATDPTANGASLTLVSWGGAYQDALREAVFRPFTEETGIVFAEDAISGTLEEVRTALGEGSAWDLVNLEYADTLTGCAEGMFEVIDWSRLGNSPDLIPAAIETCGVGNVVWAYVMAYDEARVDRAPVSWTDFWDVDGFPGRRGLRALAQWNLEAALLADGVAPRDVYTVLATRAGVDRAFAMLDRIRPHVVWWSAGAEPMDLMARGEVLMTTAYNARVSAGRAQGVNARTVWNGIIYTIDYWVIARNSPNLEAAYRFLDFTSQPAPMARLASAFPLGPANPRALPLIDPAVIKELPTTPANLRNAVLSSAAFWNREGEALERRFQAWLEH